MDYVVLSSPHVVIEGLVVGDFCMFCYCDVDVVKRRVE